MFEYVGARPRHRRGWYGLAILIVLALIVSTTIWVVRWWTYESPPLLALAEAAARCDGGDGPFEPSAGLCALPQRVDALTDYWAARTVADSGDGGPVPAPRVLVYRGKADTYCGPAVEADEAFYCPPSNAVYLDVDALDFYEAEWGPAPSTWLLAHEWAHHVQELARPDSVTTSTDQMIAMRLELQADCLAGLVINALRDQYSPDEIDDVLLLAEAFGDDADGENVALQDGDAGVPHGTSEQRAREVERGLGATGPGGCPGPVALSEG